MSNLPPDNEYQPLAFHPKNIILVLALSSSTALFLAFSVAYMYTRIEMNIPPIELPSIFILNTLILIASSASIVWAKKSFIKDDTESYIKALITTLILSFVFLIAQFYGWKQLFSQEVFINTNTTASYLYVISGMHFLHVIAGIPFLAYFIFIARKHMKEPVSVLVYFSDPEKRLSLRLLTLYWHFIDALWIYLVLFFWINHLFS